MKSGATHFWTDTDYSTFKDPKLAKQAGMKYATVTVTKSLCGMTGKRLTKDTSKVTCKVCLKQMELPRCGQP